MLFEISNIPDALMRNKQQANNFYNLLHPPHPHTKPPQHPFQTISKIIHLELDISCITWRYATTVWGTTGGARGCTYNHYELCAISIITVVNEISNSFINLFFENPATLWRCGGGGGDVNW